jgi:hypothetical protein
MSELKIFPVKIEDIVPFLAIVIGTDDLQVRNILNDKFPTASQFGEFEVLNPIELKNAQAFVIDPELYIQIDDSDLQYWALDDPYLADDLFEDKLNEIDGDKRENSNDTKLLESNCEDNCRTTSDKNPKENEDQTVWA